MADRIVSSSVTQTWQVGPSFSSNLKKKENNGDDEDITHILFTELLCLRVTTPKKQNREVALSLGVHSFVERNDKGLFLDGKSEHALFEIAVTASGAFISVLEKNAVKLNQRKCNWAKLRQGDCIYVKDHLIECFKPEDESEKTLFSPNKEISESGATKSSIHRFLLIGILLGISAIALLFIFFPWYPNAGIEGEVGNKKFQALDPSGMVAQETPTAHLDESSFNELVNEYRSKSEKLACEKMSRLLLVQSIDNIWFEKAHLFFERRCKN